MKATCVGPYPLQDLLPRSPFRLMPPPRQFHQRPAPTHVLAPDSLIAHFDAAELLDQFLAVHGAVQSRRDAGGRSLPGVYSSVTSASCEFTLRLAR